MCLHISNQVFKSRAKMFIYMRTLKCHPVIEQSGQPKNITRRVQLWSEMVKDLWRWWRILDGLSNRSPTHHPPGQTFNCDVISLKWIPQKSCPVCITKPKKKTHIRGSLRPPGSNKSIYVPRKCVFSSPYIQSNLTYRDILYLKSKL